MEDRLVNGQLGSAKHCQKDQNGKALKTYRAFYDCEVGLKSISKDAFASRSLWIYQLKRQRPILEFEQIKLLLQQLTKLSFD